MRRMKKMMLISTIALAACGGRADVPGTPAPTPPPAESGVDAPWQRQPLAPDAVSAAYHEAWRAAENRDVCAPIAPASTGAEGAVARRATFSGGWGVAYDLPEQRSAFGVAGTGVDVSDPTWSGWPHSMTWDDGSTAGYGPEGGSGPNQLAYLRITGQGCLYNVWSRLGREHLEQLLGQLRFIEQR